MRKVRNILKHCCRVKGFELNEARWALVVGYCIPFMDVGNLILRKMAGQYTVDGFIAPRL